MTYIKYLRSVGTGFLFCLLVYLAAIFYQLGVPISEQNSSIHRVYTFKSDLISSIDRPKLLIVSGSNANAGISCETIQATTGVACLNGGVHAAIGLDYMFARARSWLNPGDMVLLPLEYEHYLNDGIPSDRFVDHVIAHDPQYLRSLDLVSQIRFLGGISFERLTQGVIARSTKPEYGQGRAIAAEEVNKNTYGDNTHQLEADLTPELREKIANLQPLPIKGYLKTSYGLKNIKKFVAWCRQNNIQVLATWPNTVWFESYQQPESQAFFQSIADFYRSLDVPVLGQPQEAMYDKSMFYDSIYHPHDRGKRLRTEELIQLLQPYIDSFFYSEISTKE
ncbi:hypothetical protein [Myxosarcina sp. GI1]|uniref:hypothetical protein n=1 Tax=Myxosarcina sp. GI1 TaxID=1541065 RepID=UPI00055F3E1C|nr:hypothetical protein [Myxosarcina sp. GI1]